MACIIKLAELNGYHIFNSEEEAMQFINDNVDNIAFEDIVDENGQAHRVLVLDPKTNRNRRAGKVLQLVQRDAWNVVKADREAMGTEGTWDTEEYKKTSSSTGVGTYLKEYRDTVNGVPQRLVPEFISANYLNVETQNKLLELLYPGGNIESLRHNYFRDPEDDKNVERKHAKDFYTEYKNNGGSENISEDLLQALDLEVNAIHVRNFKSLLFGEIYHKFMELVDRDQDVKQTIQELFEDFRRKYSNFEGENFEGVINDIENLFKKNNYNLARAYKTHAKEKIDYIIKQLQNKYPRATIERPLHEVRLINRLKEDLRIEGQNPKKYLSAKLDLVFLIDGIPTVVDIKVSRNNYVETSVKGRKIQYTMAAYSKMLSQAGLNSDLGESYLLEVKLLDDPTKEGQIEPEAQFTNITHKVNEAKASLKEVFNNIQFSQNIDITAVEEDVKKIFGDYSNTGRRLSSEKEIMDALKVHQQSDGTYNIHYFLKEPNSRQVTRHTKKGVAREDLDQVKAAIASEIYQQNVNRYATDFEFFKTTFKRYLSGQISLNEFKMGYVDNYDRLLVANLTKYKNDCRLLEHEVFDRFGLLVIDTPAGVDVIHLSEHDPFTEWDITDKSATLFSDIDVASDIPKTVGYVNIAKTLLLMNEVLPKLDTKTGKLGEIKSMRLGFPKALTATRPQLKFIADTISSHSSQQVNKLGNIFADPFINVLWQLTNLHSSSHKQQYKSIFENVDMKNETLKETMKNTDIDSISALAYNPLLSTTDKLAVLKELRERLVAEFPAELSGDPTKYSRTSEITGLYYVINRAISTYENTDLMCESDAALWNPNSGLMMNSMDLMANQNIQVVREITSRGFNEIGRRYNEGFLPYMRTRIKAYEKSIGYSKARKYVWGDGANRFKNLFRRNPDNSLLNGDLILKNPWAADHTLSDEDRTFLKFVLYTLNKYHNPDWENINDMHESALSDADYRLPLVRNKNLEKLTQDGKIYFPNIRAIMEETYHKAAGIKDDFSDRIQHRVEAYDTFGAVYNEHEHRKDPRTREVLLSKYGVQAFSMDIETTLMTYVISMESADVLNNQVIPAVSAVTFSMAYQEEMSGIRLDNLIEFVKKYSKSVIYDDTAFDDEYKKYLKYYTPIRSAASAVALGWNLSNIPRELIMGIFSTISRSMFGTYGEETFSVADYTKALFTMGFDTVNFIRKVTKIELLNEHFRMTNMSISELPEQTTSNKTGFAQMFSRWMGWALVAPDYFNRMTMFIAQMMHDGSWDAYSVDETDAYLKLKYDMSKDGRFKVFCAAKGDINNVPATQKKAFLKEQALYEAMREEFVTNENEHIAEPMTLNEDGTVTHNDISSWALPRAYTLKERDSLKSFSDTTFGYYDKETKSWFYKTAFGVVFKQFMAYGSSKKVQYLNTRTDKTARGSFKQLTTNSGEKIWKITVVGDSGQQVALNVTETELNEKYKDYKDNAREVLVWTGTFVEGILNSYWHAIKEVGLSIHDVMTKDNGRQLAAKRFEALYKDYIKKGDIRHSNMLQLPWDLFLSMCFMWLIRMCFFDDPKTSGVSYKSQLAEKSWGAQMGYLALEAATVDFNFLNIIKEQYLEANLPSLSILANCGKRFWNAFGDPDMTLSQELGKGVVTSVGLFKPLRPFVSEWWE